MPTFSTDLQIGPGGTLGFMSRRQMSMDEVLSAIEELESRYGVPSERRREAIEGEPCASENLMLWDALVLSRDRMAARTS